jgi:hypothetical protein
MGNDDDIRFQLRRHVARVIVDSFHKNKFFITVFTTSTTRSCRESDEAELASNLHRD